MEKLEVIGAKKLKGNIKISGSKNSSLPILDWEEFPNLQLFLYNNIICFLHPKLKGK